MLKGLGRFILTIFNKSDEESNRFENDLSLTKREILTSPYLNHLNYKVDYIPSKNKIFDESEKKIENLEQERSIQHKGIVDNIINFIYDLLGFTITSKIKVFEPIIYPVKKNKSMEYLTLEIVKLLSSYFKQAEISSKKAFQRCKLRETAYKYESLKSFNDDLSSIVVFVISYVSNKSVYMKEIRNVLKDIYEVTDDKVFICYLMMIRKNCASLFDNKFKFNANEDLEIFGKKQVKKQSEITVGQKYQYRNYIDGILADTDWKLYNSIENRKVRELKVKKEQNRIAGIKNFFQRETDRKSTNIGTRDQSDLTFCSKATEEGTESRKSIEGVDNGLYEDSFMIENALFYKKNDEVIEDKKPSYEKIFVMLKEAIKQATRSEEDWLFKDMFDEFIFNITDFVQESSSEETVIQVSDSDESENLKPETILSNICSNFDKQFKEIRIFSNYGIYACLLSQVFKKLKEIPKDKEFLKNYKINRVDTDGELYKNLFVKLKFIGDEKLKNVKNHFEYFRRSALEVLSKYRTFEDLYPYEVFKLNFINRDFKVIKSGEEDISGCFDKSFRIKSLKIKEVEQKVIDPEENSIKEEVQDIKNGDTKMIIKEERKCKNSEKTKSGLLYILNKWETAIKEALWNIVEWIDTNIFYHKNKDRKIEKSAQNLNFQKSTHINSEEIVNKGKENIVESEQFKQSTHINSEEIVNKGKENIVEAGKEQDIMLDTSNKLKKELKKCRAVEITEPTGVKTVVEAGKEQDIMLDTSNKLKKELKKCRAVEITEPTGVKTVAEPNKPKRKLQKCTALEGTDFTMENSVINVTPVNETNKHSFNLQKNCKLAALVTNEISDTNLSKLEDISNAKKLHYLTEQYNPDRILETNRQQQLDVGKEAIYDLTDFYINKNKKVGPSKSFSPREFVQETLMNSTLKSQNNPNILDEYDERYRSKSTNQELTEKPATYSVEEVKLEQVTKRLDDSHENDRELKDFLYQFKSIEDENKKLYSTVEDIIRKEDKSKDKYLQIEKTLDFIKLVYFFKLFVYIKMYENINNFDKRDQNLEWINKLIEDSDTENYTAMLYCLSDVLNIRIEVEGLKKENEITSISGENPILTISLVKYGKAGFIQLLED